MGPWLYLTRDGGVTWHQQPVPTSPGQASAFFAPPTFFTAYDGFLPASVQNATTAGLEFFVTHDNGATWQHTLLLAGYSVVADFIDMQHGWAAASVGTALANTSDGGQHWATITLRITADITSFSQLSFESADIGWALGYSCQNHNQILHQLGF